MSSPFKKQVYCCVPGVSREPVAEECTAESSWGEEVATIQENLGKQKDCRGLNFGAFFEEFIRALFASISRGWNL